MTDGDRFIAEQLRNQLRPGEAISHTAYLTTADKSGIWGGLRKKAYWAALTPMRLFLIHTRVGAFKPLLENKGVRSIERTQIAGVHVDKTLKIALTGGKVLSFEAKRSPKHASGQAGFIDELAEAYADGRATEHLATRGKWAKIAVGVTATVITIGFFAYKSLYTERADVAIQCHQLLTAVSCTATHYAGGADARACWDVRLTCNNGRYAVGHTCTFVAAGAASEVVMSIEEYFPELDECDGVAAIYVEKTGVTRQ